jgi:uncharacterized protein YbaA (DUF1428 family)
MLVRPWGNTSIPPAVRTAVVRRPEAREYVVQKSKEIPMAYVDGFVVPVPRKNLKSYRSMAKKAGKVWRDHGALEFREWVADDVKVGKRTSFPRSVKLKPGETVVFSYIVYKSRAHRDRVNAKVMKDPRLAKMMNPKAMPFDGKRMIFGGFKVLIEA